MNKFFIHVSEDRVPQVELLGSLFDVFRYSTDAIDIEVPIQDFQSGQWVESSPHRVKVILPRAANSFSASMAIEALNQRGTEYNKDHIHQVRLKFKSENLTEMMPWQKFIHNEMSQLQAHHIMSRCLISVSPTVSVYEVTQKLARANVGSTLVCDDDGHLLGIFTERDLLVKAEKGFLEKPVKDLMTTQLSVVDSKVSVEEIYEKFNSVRFRHLPVVKEGLPVGVISIRDLMAFWGQMMKLQKDKITLEYQRAMSVVVHDLRNPIFAIKAMNEALLTGGVSAEEYAEHGFPKMVDDSCGMMTELIDELLQISSLKESEILGEKQSCDLVRMIEETVDFFNESAKKKSIEVVFSRSPQACFVQVDERRMLQAIHNLLSNAIKYTDQGGKVVLFLKSDAEEVVFSVTDFGQGIAADELPRVFDEHCKVSSLPTGGEPSTGLGLSIAKKIIEAHGGRISVKSSPRVETVFSIYLPVVAPANAAA